MLNSDKLKSQLKDALSTTLKPAIEQCFLNMFPETSDVGNSTAKEFAETFDTLVSDQLADLFATAIDSYIRNISITGTIVTKGTRVMQTARISSNKVPTINGKIINTLGIS